MPVATARQAAASALDNAYDAFIRDMGDGSGDAFVAAYDYREEGYRIAEAAFALDADDREFFIENEADDCADDSAKGLIVAAADFRLAELEAEASRLAVVVKASQFMQAAA